MTTSFGAPPPRGWVRPGEVLVHIGLPKTGTTSLQHALAAARPVLCRRGIDYPGRGSSQSSAARSALDLARWHWLGDESIDVGRSEWRALLRGIDRSPAGWRHVVSAELLCTADSTQVERIVRDLGSVRVVIGVRPLGEQLVSFWQQRARAGLDQGLDDWLLQLLERDPDGRRARAGRVVGLQLSSVVRRWASCVGADSVAVVVVGGDERAQFEAFESMLDLDPGVLTPSSDPQVGNRGLTREQAEVLVRFNAMLDRSTVTHSDYERSMRLITEALLSDGPAKGAASRIDLPSWAVSRVAEIARADVDVIAASGVHVIGDPAAVVPMTSTGADADPDGVDAFRSDVDDRGLDLAAELLLALHRSGSIAMSRPTRRTRWIPPAMLPMMKQARDRMRAVSSRWHRLRSDVVPDRRRGDGR